MVRDISEAMEYVKGYCEKHPTCEGRNGNPCTLYDPDHKCCFIYSSPIPSDWIILKEGEDED